MFNQYMRKGCKMKKIGLLSMVIAFVLLAGCQDSQLSTCQEEKLALQGQLDEANTTIAQKDKKIEGLKDEVFKVNQKAFQSVRTMLEKQNAKDIERKKKIAELEAQVKQLQAQ